MERSCLFKVQLFFVVLFIIISSGLSDSPRSTLIAIYMVGSDLESLDNCATDDMKEILAGLSEDSNNYDLVIGYGGARKIGWKGLTFATLKDIRNDYKNGIIGDEHYYQSRETEINMGSSEGLSHFLQKIKDFGSYNRYILIFWDHGGAYYGICFDENYDLDGLDLLELSSSLKASDIHWDLIGMDACLMGSYEVAKAVESSADYLMVSEEAEPGHGWNYTLPLNVLSHNPDISIPGWGKIWIDEYIDNPYHETHKKTLALINLQKITEIESILSYLGGHLSTNINDMLTYNGVGTSISNSQRYGYDPQRDQEIAVDLYDLSTHLKQVLKDNSYGFEKLQTAISEAVIYARNDGTRPGSHGLSIFSPRMKDPKDFESVENSVQVISGWADFTKNYMTFVRKDTGKPVITDFGDGTFQITDDYGLAYVRLDTDWMPEIFNFTHSYGLKSEPVLESTPGVYIPTPDDQTFYLKDLETGMTVPFFHSFIGKDSLGQENYFGYVQINSSGRIREAVINPIRNTTTKEITYSLYPYELKENGEMIFTKGVLKLEIGDILIPKIVERFLLSDNPRFQYTPYTPLNVTGEVKVVRDRLPYGAFYSTLTASDYNLNYAMVTIGELRFPNNASVAVSAQVK